MDYLKLFQNHSEYEAFVSGGTMVKPNVSHCVSENEVHYNPIETLETRLIVTYNVVDDSQATQLYYYEEDATLAGIDRFTIANIDGVDVSVNDVLDWYREEDNCYEGCYNLSAGQHTVMYTLTDPTTLGYWTFRYCDTITSVIIPNGVTTIDARDFANCINLTSVTMPNSITTINNDAFANCSSLTSITLGDNVATIGQNAFNRCTNLSSINIPNSVVSIGSNAFCHTYLESSKQP